MDKALPWPFGRLFGKRTEEAAPAKATTRFGGDNDEDPVFVDRWRVRSRLRWQKTLYARRRSRRW